MSFEQSEATKESASKSIQKSGKIIESKPGLRNIYKALDLRHSEVLPSGERIDPRELPEKVKPWENTLELSDNIREVVRDFVTKKIPGLKDNIPSIEDLPDKKLLEALSNNWFEEIDEEVGGQRREVLLAVLAHMVNSLENKIYGKILTSATEQDLAKINLTPDLRDLTVKLLEVSMKADPLFIRFLAASQLTPAPPEDAKAYVASLPGSEKKYTPASLFPHETKFISRGFGEIAKEKKDWQTLPGGDIFQKYLEKLSELYGETDPEKIMACQAEVDKLSDMSVRSGFPIIVTSAVEGYYKPPYIDPELRISLLTPESEKEEALFRQTRQAMAENLDTLSVSQFKKPMEEKFIRNTVSLGAFGVNLTFNASAQSEPSTLIFLNEQIRQLDRAFPLFADMVSNTDTEFKKLDENSKREILERMSRLNVVMHEFSHEVYPGNSPENKRLGNKAGNYFSEASAEIVYRGMLPEIIEKKGLPGTKEQWAIATLIESLQMLKGEEKDSEYRLAAIYSLNELFEKGVVFLSDDSFTIKDYEEYYRIQKEAAKNIIAAYEDGSMDEKKAQKWLKKNCVSGEKLREAEAFLEELVELRKRSGGEAVLARIQKIEESDEKILDIIEDLEKRSFPDQMQTDREGLQELLEINGNIHLLVRDMRTKEYLAYLSAIPAEEEADSFLEWDPDFKPGEKDYYLESVSALPSAREQRIFSSMLEKLLAMAREQDIPKISMHARRGLSEILQKRYRQTPLRTIENWQGWEEPFDYFEIKVGKR